MQELRFVAVSEDGSYAVLAIPGRSGRYILPIDERLRAVALGQTSRLAQYEIEVESPLRPKEIQARIRAGETAEEIADAAGIPVERVRWFEGPVLAERAYIADQAQSGSVRRAGDATGPGPRLGDIVTERLSAAGSDPADGQWDSRKRGDGNWQVSLTFPSAGRLHVAEWVFDPRRRHVMPDDDNAARLSLPESELPAEPVPQPGEATVTPIASRLGAAAGMGGGVVNGPGVSRFRPERSVIPDRSLGVDRSLVERPQPAERSAAPDRTATGLADRGAMADRGAVSDRTAAPERASAPVPPRAGQQERPAQGGRHTNPGYAEFPESAPYRAPAPSDEPPAQRETHGYEDPGSMSSAYHTVAEPPAYREPAPDPRTYREPVGFRAPGGEPPAYREPAAYQDPEAAYRPAAQPEVHDPRSAPAARHDLDLDDAERGLATPPRPVVFEDPEPSYFDEQLDLTTNQAPAPPESRYAGPVTHEPAPARPAPEPATGPAATAPPEPTPTAAERQANAERQAAAERQANAAPVAASAEAPKAQPAAREPEPAVAQAEPSVAASVAKPETAPEAAPVAPARSQAPGATVATETATAAEAATPTEPSAQAEPAAVAKPTVAEPAAAANVPEPAAAPAAATPGPSASKPTAEVPAPAEPTSAEDSASSRRPGAKKNAKGRRSSVPSWDEIMLGSSRQRD